MIKPFYQQAAFYKSAYYLKDLPPDQGLEVAFIGRSNAGKSTAINILTGQRQLAKVSKTPGRTQLINFFTLNEECKMVDLPGYGFAKVSHDIQKHWQKTLGDFLGTRKALQGLIIMMDIRHPLQESDIQMLDWCEHHNIPVHILLTKADKLKKNMIIKTESSVKKQLTELKLSASFQIFSALYHIGIETCYQVLDQWFKQE